MTEKIEQNKNEIDYFPLKVAKGKQFYNRLNERKLLKRNIDLVRHTVLVSPRRYGKTSLVYYVANEIKIPFEVIDLFLAHDDRAVTKRILDGIGNIISQVIPASSKVLQLIQGYFSHFKIGLNAAGYSIEFVRESDISNSVDIIFDALKSLVKLVESKQKKVVLFLDEFQDIANAESSKSIQGAIRHVAQSTDWIVFIFSGSNRHLLLNLFDDKKMPLYMLCDKIILERMSAESCMTYLQAAAKKRWKSPLEETVLTRLLTLTELHPFYINMLCNELWKKNTLPDIEAVSAAWQLCYEQEERRIVVELENLTNNQLDILKSLAIQSTTELTGKTFLAAVGLSSSSAQLAIKALINKDMMYQIKQEDPQLTSLKKGQYRVLDPLVAFSLRKYR